MDLVVVRRRQAGRHPPPEDPPLGPALDVLGVPDPLVEDRPEGLDPDLVEREAPARPEAEAGEVEPARLVPRALEPLLGQVAERLPERPQGRGRPLVARDVEHLFEPLDQPRRARSPAGRRGRRSNAARIAAIAASSSDCSMTTRSASSPATVARGRGLAGRPAELDLEPPAAVVGPRLAPELDRADLGHPRRQADRARARPSPCGRPASGSEAAAARGSSRGRRPRGRPAGRRAGPSCWPAGRRPAGPSGGRSRGRSIAISSPSWASRGTTQSQGLVGLLASRSPT